MVRAFIFPLPCGSMEGNLNGTLLGPALLYVVLAFFSPHGGGVIEPFKTDAAIYSFNGPERRSFFKSSYIAPLDTMESAKFTPMSSDSKKFHMMVAVINSYGNLYITCADGERARAANFLVQQLAQWVDEGFDLRRIPDTEYILIPDILIHLHTILSDRGVSHDEAAVQRTLTHFRTGTQELLAGIEFSVDFMKNVASSCLVTTLLLIAMLEGDRAEATALAGRLQLTLQTARGEDALYLIQDESGLRYKTFCKYFTWVLIGLHIAQKALLQTEQALIENVTSTVMNTYLASAKIMNAVGNMVEDEASGLVWGWVLPATFLSPTVAADLQFQSAVRRIQMNTWAGIAGSTWLHLGRGQGDG
jgi:hypothetical protein